MNQKAKILLLAAISIAAILLAYKLFYPGTCEPPLPPPPVAPESVVPPKPPLPEDIVGERMDDTNYVASLTALIDERRTVIAEAHAIRTQMEALLTNTVPAVSSPVSGASSSGPEQSPVAEATQNPELEAPDTDTSPAPLTSTNTALRAGTVLSAPRPSSPSPLSSLDPTLLAQVRQMPEWNELEARLNALSAQRDGIQIRTRTLIRERMELQYAARAAENPEPIKRPPSSVVKPIENPPNFKQPQPITITNIPPGGMKQPPVPERNPIK